MIVIKLDVTKIPKERIFVGTKGKYLDLKLVENKNGRDEYGNDGFVAIGVSKELREAGDKGEIIGNWKTVGSSERKPNPQPQPKSTPDPDLDDSDIPF